MQHRKIFAVFALLVSSSPAAQAAVIVGAFGSLGAGAAPVDVAADYLFATSARPSGSSYSDPVYIYIGTFKGPKYTGTATIAANFQANITDAIVSFVFRNFSYRLDYRVNIFDYKLGVNGCPNITCVFTPTSATLTVTNLSTGQAAVDPLSNTQLIVPEAAAIGLFGLGLLGVVARRRASSRPIAR